MSDAKTQLRELFQAWLEQIGTQAHALRAADYLCESHHGQRTSYPLHGLAECLEGTEDPDSLALQVLRQLTLPPASVLTSRWIYFSPIDGEEYEIDDEEVAAAVRDKIFLPPDSADSAPDFADHLCIIFESTARLDRLIKASYEQ